MAALPTPVLPPGVTSGTVIFRTTGADNQETAITVTALVAPNNPNGATPLVGRLVSIIGSTPPGIVPGQQVTLEPGLPKETPGATEPGSPTGTKVSIGGHNTTTPVVPNPNGSGNPVNDGAGSGSGTNTGLVAGVAIGCLIAGALIALAIAFMFYKKRQQKYNLHVMPITAEPKGYHAPLPPPPNQEALQLAQFLLDASSDKDIAAELHSLGQLIQQHVENNYHLHPVQADPQALALALVQLGLGNGGSLNPDTIVALALEPHTRHIALQHVISQVIFSGVDVSSRSRLSMLPAPVAAFLQSIPANERGKSNAEGDSP
jgi:hypothetical protein